MHDSPSNMLTTDQQLGLLEEAVVRVSERELLRATRKQMEAKICGIPQALVCDDPKPLASAIQRALAQGHLIAKAPVRHWVQLEKKRLLHRYSPEEQIAQSAIARAVQLRFESELPDSVHSYRQRHSAQSALQVHAKKIKKSRLQDSKNPVWVIRRDIQNYTDSIPWISSDPWLQKLLSPLPASWRQYLLESLELSRPGFPTGSPLTPILANAYLIPFDRLWNSMDCSYTRYGDDLTWISDRSDLAHAIQAQADLGIQELGLQWNPKKRSEFMLNSSGFRAKQSIEYLGYSLSSFGEIGWSSKKMRVFLKTQKARLIRTSVLIRRSQVSTPLSAPDRQEAISALIRTLNRSLITGDWIFPDSRRQLREIDHELRKLMREIGERFLLGSHSRELTPRNLIDRGLMSLEYFKNHPHA